MGRSVTVPPPSRKRLVPQSCCRRPAFCPSLESKKSKSKLFSLVNMIQNFCLLVSVDLSFLSFWLSKRDRNSRTCTALSYRLAMVTPVGRILNAMPVLPVAACMHSFILNVLHATAPVKNLLQGLGIVSLSIDGGGLPLSQRVRVKLEDHRKSSHLRECDNTLVQRRSLP